MDLFINFTEQYFVSFYLIIKINFQSVTNGDFQNFYHGTFLRFQENTKKKETFKLPKKFVVNKRKLDFFFLCFCHSSFKQHEK